MKQSGQTVPPLPRASIAVGTRPPGDSRLRIAARPPWATAGQGPQDLRGLPPAQFPRVARRRLPTASDSTTAQPSPLALDLKLKSAPFEPTDIRFPINLATALRLSDARPLIVAAAQAERVGRRGRSHAGQGPLAPRNQPGRRLSSPRRRRPRLQQGHLDRRQHQFLLRRRRPLRDHLHDRCHLRALACTRRS